MAPLSLDTLPPEITYAIFTGVETFGRDFNEPRNLLSLCQTCKRLNDIATPLLVRSWASRDDKAHLKLRRFIRHLLQHPEYEMEVRHVSFHRHPFSFPKLEFSQVEKTTLKRLASESILGNDAGFVKRVGEGDGDALLALLLMRATGLEIVCLLSPTWTPVWRVLDMISQRITDSGKSELAHDSQKLPLQCLHTADILAFDDRPMDANSYGALFCLPRLSDVRILGGATRLDPSHSSYMPRGVSSVTSLILSSRSKIDTEGIGRMVESCKALKHLTIYPDFTNAELNMKKFGQRLAQAQGHALEDLLLHDFRELDDRMWLGDALVGLKVLRRLVIQMCVLYSHQQLADSSVALKPLLSLLPASLKILEIAEPADGTSLHTKPRSIGLLEGYVSDLMAVGQRPALEELRLNGWYHRENSSACLKLRQLCSEAGIYLNLTPSGETPRRGVILM